MPHRQLYSSSSYFRTHATTIMKIWSDDRRASPLSKTRHGMRRFAPNCRALLSLSAISVAVLSGISPARAWGTFGHTLISRAGAGSFPESLPAFVRSSAAVEEIAMLGAELDRSKGAGVSHDRDLDPGHYIDIDDRAMIAAIVSLSALPPSRQAFDNELQGSHTDSYQMGFLPYALIDGWQQIAKDFAIWRIDVVAARSGDERSRARFDADRSLRELLTIRDIGVWSHYVGDASQPLHTSIHFNGWGTSANPDGFTTSPRTHATFESAFVNAHATLLDVRAAMTPLPKAKLPSAPIAQLVGDYLLATNASVVPFYRLEKSGAFAHSTREAIAFADMRLAAGASTLRDLVAGAYDASTTLAVGYPKGVTPAQAESGEVAVPNSVLGDAAE